MKRKIINEAIGSSLLKVVSGTISVNIKLIKILNSTKLPIFLWA
jgi:hypothetical protein